MADTGKNFYLTTTLPYVNADPHIGFALELVQADVICRHKLRQRFEVFFNMGSDEHGAKIFRKAKELGEDPKAYCDRYAAKFAALKEALNISWTHFERTTDPGHVKAAQEFWSRCQENGDIYKKNYRVKYCVGCELEKTESELMHGRCPIHPNLEIELIEEENYFFRYSKYQKPLLDLYRRHPDFVAPETRLHEIVSFTERGLEDFSISRVAEKMPWGIPVPDDPSHVMYVWFDALVSYISALGWPENRTQFEAFWPGAQVAGKDNLRQQASMWQAMLMSAGLSNSKQIFIHGFVTADGQKMSKSLGNVVDPFMLVQKYGTDAVRYYLLREISSTEDGDFSMAKFEQRYNGDLAGGIGNLLARTIALVKKTKNQRPKTKASDQKLKRILAGAEKEAAEAIDSFRFNDGLKAVWEVISACDKYLNEQKPWEGGENALQAVANVLTALEHIANMLEPFMPDTAARIKKALQGGESKPLFPRIQLIAA